MKIGFIGAGRVGTAFGYYLKSHHYVLSGYFSKSAESAQKAACLTNSLAFTSTKDLLAETDILFITTVDGEIERVCDTLSHDHLFRPGQTVVHMSGALSSNVLHSAKEMGCHTASLHPIQSFAGFEKALSDLPHTVFSLEGDDGSMTILSTILGNTGNDFFKINASQKPLYHAATCIFSNYLTTLIAEGLDYFRAIGISEADGLKAVLPLIRGTIDNISLLGTQKALTGPIARGDSATVQQQLESIHKIIPEKLPLYEIMTKRTLALAQDSHLTNADKIKALSDVLSEYAKGGT